MLPQDQKGSALAEREHFGESAALPVAVTIDDAVAYLEKCDPASRIDSTDGSNCIICQVFRDVRSSPTSRNTVFVDVHGVISDAPDRKPGFRADLPTAKFVESLCDAMLGEYEPDTNTIPVADLLPAMRGVAAGGDPEKAGQELAHELAVKYGWAAPIDEDEDEDGDQPTVDELAELAEKNGYDAVDLGLMFDILPDRMTDKSVAGAIGQAIEEGDDPEWIWGEVSRPKGGRRA